MFNMNSPLPIFNSEIDDKLNLFLKCKIPETDNEKTVSKLIINLKKIETQEDTSNIIPMYDNIPDLVFSINTTGFILMNMNY